MTDNIKDQHETESDEIADLEEYAARGERPPKCRGYRIKVNKEHFEVFTPTIFVVGVLKLAGFEPPENYTVRLKIAGMPPKKVKLDEEIDLRARGIEKFKVIPREQTEG